MLMTRLVRQHRSAALASVVLLVACQSNGVTPRAGFQSAREPGPPSLPHNGRTAKTANAPSAYTLLHSFKGYPHDGEDPQAPLISVNGTLYGTTQQGGKKRGGTVFAITTSGTESVLHNFAGRDGASPVARLLNVRGTLFGTTFGGGASGYGTVFSLTSSGIEKVLHSFPTGSRDGANPHSGLVNVNGTLYGTTSAAGAYCTPSSDCGTVFSITPSGTENTLHSFGTDGDGAQPEASLINVNGTLYGTTAQGGGRCGSVGCGTVFKITTSGAERVLHSFAGGPADGDTPDAGLINVNGVLYGTTAFGGANNWGTVFKITTSGTEAVIYSFGSGSEDGLLPLAALIKVKGRLYGTTYEGGHCASESLGCGTVFAVTTSGKESVIHNFAGGADDGDGPDARLVDLNGTLYGTTVFGGSRDHGTVFSLSP